MNGLRELFEHCNMQIKRPPKPTTARSRDPVLRFGGKSVQRFLNRRRYSDLIVKKLEFSLVKFQFELSLSINFVCRLRETEEREWKR